MKNDHFDDEILYEQVSDEGIREVRTDGPSLTVDWKRNRRLGGWVALAIVALLGTCMVIFWPKAPAQEDVIGAFEASYEKTPVKALGTEENVNPYAERLDTLVNGLPIALFIPHHATPYLYVGKLDEEAASGILAFQAADVRSDNWEILGDFVLEGKQLSRGISKKGFCAIIDGDVTVGTGASTPLLSEAISKRGYFFRQYPLVDGGTPVENKPKNKTVRRALCERGGQVFVAVSEGDSTLSDFAQALADLSVDNAVYLIGGYGAHGWAVDADGGSEQFGNEDTRPNWYRNASYIIWK